MSANSSTRVGIGAGGAPLTVGAWSLLLLLLVGCQGIDESVHVVDHGSGKSVEIPDSANWAELNGTPAADPVGIRIPEVDVNAPIRALEIDGRGALIPPEEDEVAGWWKAGPEPGENGPAVVAGHVDSHSGPAVFFRLSELRAGTEVFIDRADGTTAVFATYRVESHPKDAFPTEAVYGPTPGSELRLITCGGRFDDAEGRYLANVITFAQRVR